MAYFPDPEAADERGLVMVGGDLRPERLLEAYSNGIFPWYSEGQPVLWWSPDPRAIFELDGLHVSRRLQRTMRSGRFEVTIDQAFTHVMRACGERAEGTWITHAMLRAYERLHKLGFAHSVETWSGLDLVGGIYGVSIGGFFAGESMFHRESDASKAALVALFDHLRTRGYELFDTQLATPHTRRLGAVEISRKNYLRRLRAALRKDVTF
jgi:leucyl/phenylalanyl-tRNA--protein transferase